MSSPSRYPFGQQAQNMDIKSGMAEVQDSAGHPAIHPQQVRVQAIRRHSAAPPSLPQVGQPSCSITSLFQVTFVNRRLEKAVFGSIQYTRKNALLQLMTTEVKTLSGEYRLR